MFACVTSAAAAPRSVRKIRFAANTVATANRKPTIRVSNENPCCPERLMTAWSQMRTLDHRHKGWADDHVIEVAQVIDKSLRGVHIVSLRPIRAVLRFVGAFYALHRCQQLSAIAVAARAILSVANQGIGCAGRYRSGGVHKHRAADRVANFDPLFAGARKLAGLTQ